MVTVAFGVLGIFARIAVATRSITGGLVAVALLGLFFFGIVALVRRKGRAQADAIAATGQFGLDAGLDLACLPGDWPAMARETMSPTGASQNRSLPVRLSTERGYLVIEKKRSWGAGRHPFRAEVSLADVSEVEVSKSQRQLVGSSLTVGLRSGGEVRVDTSMDVDLAERVADRLRAEPRPIASLPRRSDVGIVVCSPPPPLRTPPRKAGLFYMAAVVPFFVAVFTAKTGPFAVAGAAILFVSAMWLLMRRPTSMAKWLAVALVLTAAGFALDALRTDQPLRLAGSAVCVGLAWALSRSSPSATRPPGQSA